MYIILYCCNAMPSAAFWRPRKLRQWSHMTWMSVTTSILTRFKLLCYAVHCSLLKLQHLQKVVWHTLNVLSQVLLVYFEIITLHSLPSVAYEFAMCTPQNEFDYNKHSLFTFGLIADAAGLPCMEHGTKHAGRLETLCIFFKRVLYYQFKLWFQLANKVWWKN